MARYNKTQSLLLAYFKAATERLLAGSSLLKHLGPRLSNQSLNLYVKFCKTHQTYNNIVTEPILPSKQPVSSSRYGLHSLCFGLAAGASLLPSPVLIDGRQELIISVMNCIICELGATIATSISSA